MPAAAAVAEAIVGLSEVEVYAFGPLQLYVVPMLVVPVRFNAAPAQIGLLLEAEAVGNGFTVNGPISLLYPVPTHVTRSR